MSARLITLLRGILVLGIIGSGAIQLRFAIGLLFFGTETLLARIALTLCIVIGLGCLQFAALCIWKLLNLVNADTVFSPTAITWVNRIIGAIFGFAACILLAGYVVAEVDDAPGLVLVAFLAALLVCGVALIVYVQRTLLVQATGFSADLEGVI
ncbi:hypothetical protein CATRI_05690 [Corynebacterium atrinae]|uniref:DUF2975 domain-containing protein n=1 Tax=Corynebacterium atrinae TaxID=1336740 RepID=UPI0025B4000D|nr:DUF2975 domain-containing protein [Corynebacterium atrinae]WJY63230.1 hypothetical protein CATRI_05690 [Corynebacterium atrinae]